MLGLKPVNVKSSFSLQIDNNCPNMISTESWQGLGMLNFKFHWTFLKEWGITLKHHHLLSSNSRSSVCSKLCMTRSVYAPVLYILLQWDLGRALHTEPGRIPQSLDCVFKKKKKKCNVLCKEGRVNQRKPEKIERERKPANSKCLKGARNSTRSHRSSSPEKF